MEEISFILYVVNNKKEGRNVGWYACISSGTTIYYTSDTFDAITDKTLDEDGTQRYNWVKIS